MMAGAATPLDLQAENQALRLEIAELREEMAQLRSDLMMGIALDRQRLAKLEGKAAAPTNKTVQYLDRLADHLTDLRKNGRPGIGYLEAARFLGITKARISQLKPTIKEDGRFRLDKHPTKKKRIIIALC